MRSSVILGVALYLLLYVGAVAAVAYVVVHFITKFW